MYKCLSTTIIEQSISILTHIDGNVCEGLSDGNGYFAYMYFAYMYFAWRSQKRALDTLEMDLQTAGGEDKTLLLTAKSSLQHLLFSFLFILFHSILFYF